MSKSKKWKYRLAASLGTICAAALPVSAVIANVNDLGEKVDELIGPVAQEVWFYPVIVGAIALLIIIVLSCIIVTKKKIKKEKQRKAQLEARNSHGSQLPHSTRSVR